MIPDDSALPSNPQAERVILGTLLMDGRFAFLAERQRQRESGPRHQAEARLPRCAATASRCGDTKV
jgi:hypothetical protein